MRPVSMDIKDMLEVPSALGLVFGVNLFIGMMPTKPENCVVIYDSPAGSIDATADTRNEKYYRSPFQVRIRNQKYQEAMTLAFSIMEELHGYANDTWDDTYYAFVQCTTPPTPLEWDVLNRVHIIINFQTQRR